MWAGPVLTTGAPQPRQWWPAGGWPISPVERATTEFGSERLKSTWVRCASENAPLYKASAKAAKDGFGKQRVWTSCKVKRLSSRSEEHTSELQSHSDLVC